MTSNPPEAEHDPIWSAPVELLRFSRIYDTVVSEETPETPRRGTLALSSEGDVTLELAPTIPGEPADRWTYSQRQIWAFIRHFNFSGPDTLELRLDYSNMLRWTLAVQSDDFADLLEFADELDIRVVDDPENDDWDESLIRDERAENLEPLPTTHHEGLPPSGVTSA